MASLRQERNTVVVTGPEGTFTFDRDYSPGEEPADFFGPGGRYVFEFRLYERPGRLVVVVTCVLHQYGESRSDTVYTSTDGGRTFAVSPTEPPPAERPVQVLTVI